MASFLHNIFKSEVMKAAVNLANGGHTLKVALYTSSLVAPNADDDSYSSAPYDANEVAAGGGYSTGGATLAGQAVSVDDANDRGKFDGDDVVWAASTITARYALLYDDSHASKIPIALIDFGSDKASSAGNFTIQWHTDGIILLT